MTANQLVAYNLKQARLFNQWTQEEASARLEPFLGKRWSKATFSAAERSAELGTRSREFSADEILAFARTFGVSVGWFFLPGLGEDDEGLPVISCGGSELLDARQLLDAALPHASEDRLEGLRLRALMHRPELRGQLDERIREGAAARIRALAATAAVPGVTTHAANLRRMANALESADDEAQVLFAAAWDSLGHQGESGG